MICSLPERGSDAAGDAIEKGIQNVAAAQRTTNSWMPFAITITESTWLELREPLARLLDGVVAGWRRKAAEAEARAAASEEAVDEIEEEATSHSPGAVADR